MRKRILAVGIITMMLSGIMLSAGTIVKNGNFEEDANTDQQPDDWKVGGNTIWGQEEGNRFLRINSLKPDKMSLVYKVYNIPEDAKALQLTFRGRCSNLKRGKKNWFDARIMINFKDAVGKKTGAPAPNFNKDTKGWVEKKVEFLVPEGAKTLEFMPCLFNVKSGTFDIDDIKIVAVPAEPIIQRQKEEAERRKKEMARRAALVKPQVPLAPKDKLPPMLHVEGNKIKDINGKDVWLQGISLCSMEWSASGDNILKSVTEAIDNWKANCLRLPIREDFWFGKGPYQKDGGAGYRQLVDDVVNLAGGKGVYIVLDLHRFRAPTQIHADFWKEVATKYKNHPAVLFELFNEPHDISWKVWRDGGFVSTEKTNKDVAAERKDKLKGFETIGIQKLIDVVRDTGAKNIVIPGGLDWSYDLGGILNGYALDDKGGNGIVYSSHVYPWKSKWQERFVDAAAKYPIFIGEVGCEIKPMPWQKTTEDPQTWAPDMLGLIQKYKLNWTAWCFHPRSTPRVILDWDYTPTPFWGKYVKEALSGKQFETKKMR